MRWPLTSLSNSSTQEQQQEAVVVARAGHIERSRPPALPPSSLSGAVRVLFLEGDLSSIVRGGVWCGGVVDCVVW